MESSLNSRDYLNRNHFVSKCPLRPDIQKDCCALMRVGSYKSVSASNNRNILTKEPEEEVFNQDIEIFTPDRPKRREILQIRK